MTWGKGAHASGVLPIEKRLNPVRLPLINFAIYVANGQNKHHESYTVFISPDLLNNSDDYRKWVNDAIQSMSPELLSLEEAEARRTAGEVEGPEPPQD